MKSNFTICIGSSTLNTRHAILISLGNLVIDIVYLCFSSSKKAGGGAFYMSV